MSDETVAPQTSSESETPRKPKKKLGRGAKVIIVLLCILLAIPFLSFIGCIRISYTGTDNSTFDVVEVLTNNAEVENTVTLQELNKLYDTNRVALEDEYYGKLIRVRGTVESVKNQGTMYNNKWVDGYEIRLNDTYGVHLPGTTQENKDLVLSLKEGDVLEVTGKLDSCSKNWLSIMTTKDYISVAS